MANSIVIKPKLKRCYQLMLSDTWNQSASRSANKSQRLQSQSIYLVIRTQCRQVVTNFWLISRNTFVFYIHIFIAAVFK